MAGFTTGLLSLDAEAFPTVSGDNNNVPVFGSLLYVTVTNDDDAITGLALGENIVGAVVFVVNIGPTNTLVLKHNTGSDPQNRILTASGADVSVQPFETALLGYDTVDLHWHLIKFVG
jgi:hypothetical protein